MTGIFYITYLQTLNSKKQNNLVLEYKIIKNPLKPKLILILFSICFLFFFEPAFAIESEETLTQNKVFETIQDALEISDEPLVYDVQITLMDISNVDYINGSYSFLFWITLSSDEIDFTEIPPPQIDFVNGKIDSIAQEYTKKHSYSAKVVGTFFTNMDFSSYPLLHLSLPIIVEPVQFESHEIKFVKSELQSDVDSELTILGFIYQDTTEEVKDYTYSDGSIFSRLIITYDFETPFLTPFLVGIFPILVMAAFVIFLFGLNPTNHDIKIEMVIGILVSAIFFHMLDVGDTLPPLEYLTLEDKIMTMLYIMLGVVMIETVAQRKWNENDDMEKAKQIDKKFRYIFAAASITTITLVFQL